MLALLSDTEWKDCANDMCVIEVMSLVLAIRLFAAAILLESHRDAFS